MIFSDQGTLSKKRHMISIPYDRIVGVASADEGIVFFITQQVLNRR